MIMLGEHHHLVDEMPEYKDKIHELRQNDRHFIKLYNEFVELDKEIYRIEEDIETPSDDYTESLKKQRVSLKDQLYNMLKTA